MSGAGGANMQAFTTQATNQTTNSSDAGVIANVAYFSIPIIILWIGMGVSQKMGIAGANMVVGAGKGTAKWAGKKFSGYNAVKRQVDGFNQQRKARQDEKNKNNLGSRLGGRANDAQDLALARMGSKEAQKRYDKRKETKNKDDIKNKAEEKETLTTDAKRAKIIANQKTPATNDKDRVEHAADAKAAINDKNYINKVEDSIKKDLREGADRTNFAGVDNKVMEQAMAENDLRNHEAVRPAAPTMAMPTHPGAGASDSQINAYQADLANYQSQHADHQTKMATWSADRTKFKEKVDGLKNAVEAEEKKVMQDLKTKHIDELHKMVQTGEDVGKVKPRL